MQLLMLIPKQPYEDSYNDVRHRLDGYIGCQNACEFRRPGSNRRHERAGNNQPLALSTL